MSDYSEWKFVIEEDSCFLLWCNHCETCFTEIGKSSQMFCDGCGEILDGIVCRASVLMSWEERAL